MQKMWEKEGFSTANSDTDSPSLQRKGDNETKGGEMNTNIAIHKIATRAEDGEYLFKILEGGVNCDDEKVITKLCELIDNDGIDITKVFTKPQRFTNLSTISVAFKHNNRPWLRFLTYYSWLQCKPKLIDELDVWPMDEFFAYSEWVFFLFN